MTFLELCQRFWQEAGLSGPGPQSVTNARGMEGKAVRWIQAAWQDIQASRRGWRFLRRWVTVPLQPGQRDYTILQTAGAVPAPGFAPDWRMPLMVAGAATLRDTSGTVYPLTWLDWPSFREAQQGAQLQAGLPTKLTQPTGNILRLDVPPDQAYSLQLEYVAQPQVLFNNLDIPQIAEHLRPVILWKALQLYSGNDSAGELFQLSTLQLKSAMSVLLLEELEPPSLQGRPLG